jgi:signal transduction histidine kinase
MLFVMEPKELSRRDTLMLHIIPTVLVFIAFMGVSLFSVYSAKQDVKKENDRLTNQVVQSTEQVVSDRVALYEEVLHAGVGLYNASDFVSRNEWHNFVSTFNLHEHYPGLQGLGYIEVIPPSSLVAHQERIRAEGFPDYQVFPTGSRDLYSSLIYVEPFEGKNIRTFGYDMLTDPVRKDAMEEARDTNRAILSKRVHLLQDDDKPNAAGLLMFVPLYKTGSPHNTVEERRQALQGYIYAPFRADDFFGDIYTKQSASNPGMQFQVLEGDAANKQEVYKSPGYDAITNPINGTQTTEYRVNNRELSINYRVPTDSIAKSTRNRPINTLIGGLLFSIILAGLVLVLLISRTRSLAYAEAREVQQAKDDLLSLASHQLRTPATGVKQYIGMLRQGYAGSLSAMQKDLLGRAYASNERQLGIIDEILHVARIDTGRITLDIQRVPVTKLVRDVAKEHRESAKIKQQKLQLHLPTQPILIDADPQYLRMVIDNLLSNATKYTADKGAIDVYMRKTRHEITLEVKDTGVGIKKQDQQLLFKKFSRIHNELTRQTEGSGIGLYITQKIVNLHGGKIEVISDPKIGSSFIITLPRKQTLYNKLYNKGEKS